MSGEAGSGPTCGDGAGDAGVTLVVVPRERWSFARASLESVLRHTRRPFELVYVDAASPPSLRRWLERRAREEGFRLVRSERILTGNEARNVGLREVRSRYVAFLDNDVLVAPGWLDALVRCAEETEAWVVGPLYLMGPLEEGLVHGARGITRVRTEGGRRGWEFAHPFKGERLASVPPLRREPCELAEFHCMLVRTAAFERLGPFDEGLLSCLEHHDFSLAVRAAGGSVWFEPQAVVSWVDPVSLAWSDLPFYLLRWSEGWNRTSRDRFQAKWGLPADDPVSSDYVRGPRRHRQRFLRPLRKALRLACGRRAGEWAERTLLFPAETVVNRVVAPWIEARYRNARR